MTNNSQKEIFYFQEMKKYHTSVSDALVTGECGKYRKQFISFKRFISFQLAYSKAFVKITSIVKISV